MAQNHIIVILFWKTHIFDNIKGWLSHWTYRYRKCKTQDGEFLDAGLSHCCTAVGQFGTGIILGAC